LNNDGRINNYNMEYGIYQNGKPISSGDWTRLKLGFLLMEEKYMQSQPELSLTSSKYELLLVSF